MSDSPEKDGYEVRLSDENLVPARTAERTK